jgi:hypothetical protein
MRMRMRDQAAARGPKTLQLTVIRLVAVYSAPSSSRQTIFSSPLSDGLKKNDW